MSAVKQKIEMIMAQVNELMDLKANKYFLPRKFLEKAIILSIGGDPRTINKYIDLMVRLEYIKPGKNQYVFIVIQRRL